MTSYRFRPLTFPAIITASGPYYPNRNHLLYAEFFLVVDGKRAHNRVSRLPSSSHTPAIA